MSMSPAAFTVTGMLGPNVLVSKQSEILNVLFKHYNHISSLIRPWALLYL